MEQYTVHKHRCTSFWSWSSKCGGLWGSHHLKKVTSWWQRGCDTRQWKALNRLLAASGSSRFSIQPCELDPWGFFRRWMLSCLQVMWGHCHMWALESDYNVATSDWGWYRFQMVDGDFLAGQKTHLRLMKQGRGCTHKSLTCGKSGSSWKAGNASLAQLLDWLQMTWRKACSARRRWPLNINIFKICSCNHLLGGRRWLFVGLYMKSIGLRATWHQSYWEMSEVAVTYSSCLELNRTTWLEIFHACYMRCLMLIFLISKIRSLVSCL